MESGRKPAAVVPDLDQNMVTFNDGPQGDLGVRVGELECVVKQVHQRSQKTFPIP